MAKKELHRSEINKEHQWDLESVYQTEEEFEQDCRLLSALTSQITEYESKVALSAQNLLDTLKLYYELDRVLGNVYIYAYMKADEDTSNTENQTRKGKIGTLATKASEASSYLIPELLKTPYEQIKRYIEENKELESYERNLEEIYRAKDYILSEKEEKIFSSLSDVLSSSKKTASLLRDSDMVFGTIQDENGETVTISNLNYRKYIESFNRDVRKNAFSNMYEAYGNLKNTLNSTLETTLKTQVAMNKIRGYQSNLHATLYPQNIDEKIYHNLIDTVNKKLSSLHAYYQMKKDILNVEELHLYDTYVPIVGESNEEYTFEQARQLIVSALAPLGETYISDLQKAFDEKWIDIYPNEGKRSGAYSWGSFDTKSFILLNYQNRLDDVSTTAHELGHSLHSYYSKNNNSYQNHSYVIFVAEVASTVNELLLFNHLLHTTKSDTEKLVILNEMLEMFKGTLFRQTMFAEFELEMHTRAWGEEPITHDKASDFYYALNEKYFGPAVTIDSEIRYEWLRIPHFYTPYYVYQYATGISAACYIVEGILEGREGALESYLEFLKTGGRDYPVELLKIAGVDMNDPKVVESAIHMFENTVKQFKELYKN